MLDAVKEKLEKADKIIIALSGGADSVALTHILCSNFPKEKIISAHVNHGIRGDEALRDENFVRNFCETLQIELKVLSVNIPQIAKERNESEEKCGRDVRYEFFQSIANSYKNSVIATAHNLNDSAETVIYNLIRGTGIKGMCGIPCIRDNIVRPILDMTRNEIENYCENNSLEFVTDSTNLENDYTRNKIRNCVFPVLENINTAYLKNISKTYDIFSQAYDYINIKANEILKESQNKFGLCVKNLLKHEAYIVRETIILFLRKNNITNFEQKHINEIYEKLRTGGAVNLPMQHFVSIKQNVLSVFSKSNEHLKDFILEINRIYQYKNKNIAITGKYDILNSKINNLLFYNAIDCDKIKNTIEITTRKQGDVFPKAGRNASKTLKKLFNEAKIPAHLRDDIIIVRDGIEIVFIEGFGVSQNYCTDKNTKNYYKIEIN